VVARALSDLSEAALSLWRFAAERQPGRPKIRVLSLSGTDEAWIGGHTILQVVNDNMPFLMDSVTAAMTGLGFDVQHGGPHIGSRSRPALEQGFAANCRICDSSLESRFDEKLFGYHRTMNGVLALREQPD
jgi:hypothetical protein